jgi:hypothetical protein
MTHPMTKVIVPWLVLVGFAGAASAQPAAPPPAPAAADAQPPPPAEAHPALSPGDARKLCTQAMNADPKLAAEIVKTADEAAAVKRDADTVAAHTDAYAHVQKNERHVIYAYAAMWIVAALFVIFLWRRQQGLRTEIANLRRDLEAAAEEARPTGAQS